MGEHGCMRPYPLLRSLTLAGVCLTLLDACGPSGGAADVVALLRLEAAWPPADPGTGDDVQTAFPRHTGADRMLASSNDGRWGYLLKVVDGAHRYRLNADEPFEPASTLKLLYHLHALREVQAGRAHPEEPLPWYRASDGRDDVSTPEEDEREFGCPVDREPAVGTLEEGLRAMMERSDNRWTLAVRRRFGDAAVAGTARILGMDRTELRHRIGCAAATGQDPGQVEAPNVSTLAELAGLVEGVSNGSALAPGLAGTFFDLMANDRFLRLDTVLREENAAVGLPRTVLEALTGRLHLAWKSGKYNIGTYKCQSVVGLVEMLHYIGAGVLGWRRLVVGVYVDDATWFPEQGSRATLYSLAVASELLRDEVRAMLTSYRRAIVEVPRLETGTRGR